MQSNITNYIYDKVKELLLHLGLTQEKIEQYDTLVISVIVIAIAITVMEIAYRIAFFATKRIVKRKQYNFLLQMLKGKRLRKVAHLLVPATINTLLPITIDANSIILHYIELAVSIYYVIAMVMATIAVLGALGDSAFNNSKYHDRPVKGFIQVGKIIVILVAVIIIISILTNKSPLYLIGGLGAFAAVLMLIAKDSIMGFVGGFLLLENDMVRLGDWIEIPGTSINGNVFDISLTIVKVRNWDNTIATIPPYTLINGTFINWRGMSESGGRRIARGYTVKLDNIKPCSETMLRRLRKLDSELATYISQKTEQTLGGKTANTANPDGLINGTIDTNAGLFRAYAQMYLKRHPLIRKDMLVMVRTLEPNETGLPIQFYCFTTTTEWVDYESIQSEIMEHFASVMPLFELYPFQTAGSRDTVISGLLEGQYPIERIDGLPYKTVK
ncbi:MAG: mechanosensitive ion channel [Bacteroidaceae bacterium]|nr:mechanosensitive ion channel [Bacteroidaceae bacterium]